MAESIQKKLDRVRPPKVQIKYEVETYDAIEKKELPMVVGVLSDLGGDNTLKDKNGRDLKIKDRKFVNIDRDNFNEVLKANKPRAQFRVPDKISNEKGKAINVDIDFENLGDFHPEKVALKVEPLKELVEMRQNLTMLLQKMDGNDELENQLNNILTNADQQNFLKGLFSQDKSDSKESGAAS